MLNRRDFKQVLLIFSNFDTISGRRGGIYEKVICVVEDEKDLNELVKRYLEKEGYEVRSYYTYEQASIHTVDDDVHLWILDIMLDDKSGLI